MLNERILFRFGSKNQPITRFGEIDMLSRPCYFRGIELGYNNISFEWPLNLDYKIKCPKKTILPLKFINYNINHMKYDKIINLIDNDIFYRNSMPLYSKLDLMKRDHYSFLNYLNKYYIQYNERPIYNIPKDNIRDDYILIHTRMSQRSPTRNPKRNTYINIINLLKNKYKEYKLYRCGHIIRKDEEFNSLFDGYIENVSDFNAFLKLMNNCSLFIGCSSGPIQYAYSFGKPIIELDIPRTSNWGYLKNNYIGLGNYYSEKYWKRGLFGIYGDTVDYYINKEKYLKLFRGYSINKDRIYRFMDRWLKD